MVVCTRGEAINRGRRNLKPGQKLFLYFNGERYATICAGSEQEAIEFGKSWGLKLESRGLEEIQPFRYPELKPWKIRMRQKLYNLKERLLRKRRRRQWEEYMRDLSGERHDEVG